VKRFYQLVLVIESFYLIGDFTDYACSKVISGIFSNLYKSLFLPIESGVLLVLFNDRAQPIPPLSNYTYESWTYQLSNEHS